MNAPQACIMGWPVSHSRSPLIHGIWLKTYGIAGLYTREAVAPETAPAFFRSLRTRGYCGGNVTVPLKEIAFAAADRFDEAAARIGAVNTLWYEGDQLIGGNTDAYGFAANLDHDHPHWRNRCETALVIGAGGAALGVVHALLGAGVRRIWLANRSLAKAEAVAVRFGDRVRPITLAAITDHLSRTDLLVNTTSLGMSGQPPLELSLDTLKTAAIVADIVYVPLKTPLLHAAEARGHAISTGLGMLLHQAVPGFERWFGLRPEVTPELAALITADIMATS